MTHYSTYPEFSYSIQYIKLNTFLFSYYNTAIKFVHKLLIILAELMSLDLFAMVKMSIFYQCPRNAES